MDILQKEAWVNIELKYGRAYIGLKFNLLVCISGIFFRHCLLKTKAVRHWKQSIDDKSYETVGILLSFHFKMLKNW
jgi:hypothetical protein